MQLVTFIRSHIDRIVQRQRLNADLASFSDAEMKDLGLSYAQVSEMIRRQAYSA